MSTATFQQARSGIQPANLQQLIDAEQSPQWATLANAQQYLSPDWLVKQCVQRLKTKGSYFQNVLDPQCGMGALLDIDSWTDRYGIDIDTRIDKTKIPRAKILTGNCVKVMEAIDDLYPDLRFDCINANPPFGKRWKLADGTIADSTELTWQFAINHGCRGYFIANDVTLRRLGIDKHPNVFHYETHADVWKQCEVVIGIAFWKNENFEPTTSEKLGLAWSELTTIMEEEEKKVPPFNLTLNPKGTLNLYLSTRLKVKRKITREEVLRLTRVNGMHPLALTIDKETRSLLRELIDCGFYTIEPKAKAAIESALAEVATLACPIMPATSFEKVAYADEEETLFCKASCGLPFTPGKRYPITTSSYNFTLRFERNKVHFDEKTGITSTAKHNCQLTGQDRYIEVQADDLFVHKFLANPDPDFPKGQHDETLLWDMFQEPVIETISDRHPEKVAANRDTLRFCEMLGGYTYYPGQLDYVAKVAVKDYGLIAAATGAGKSMLALSLIQLKAPHRALIIAPQGTLRSSGSEDEDDEEGEEYQASQWVQEIRRFTPAMPCFELFSFDDYERIKRDNQGVLPAGIYISYFQAMFQNKALESLPESWTTEKLWAKFNPGKAHPSKDVFSIKTVSGWYDFSKLEGILPKSKIKAGAKFQWDSTDYEIEEVSTSLTDDFTVGVGMEKDGIRCIVSPCLSTVCGHEFDMVCVDEAHYACNLTANLSQMLIRMQPKYRFAFTATPIPNIVSNLFSLMGWLCVDDWYRGDRRNAAWPYARMELEKFESVFLSEERDFTQESINKAGNPDWKGKCVKKSPVISSPARLLKLLSPTLAFISKEACNPNVVPCKVVDIRVPMGKQQAALYGHFLERANIPSKHPLIRARKQIAYLRNICADPAGFTHHTNASPRVSINFNPKTIAVLELVKDIISRGEQVVIVSARVGQSNTLHQRLVAAGIKVSRIDSTMPPTEHAAQSNLFKARKTQVHIMGIKCAVGHSYPECPNLIIASLEYSYGSKHQAEGRVWRVNSKYPVTVYCVLCKDSIEETMFDVVATKQDAATICLYGQRVPRDFKPVDMGEVLATSIAAFTDGGTSEAECEQGWATLKQQLHGFAS